VSITDQLSVSSPFRSPLRPIPTPMDSVRDRLVRDLRHHVACMLIQSPYSLKQQSPIVSLQMLWGKMYVIWDPNLAQAALRARGPSFEPFVVDFAQKASNLGKDVFARVLSQPKLVPDFTDAIHASMQPALMHKMNVHALKYISGEFDRIRPGTGGGLEAENMYTWIRDLISLASTRALFGKENPFEKDHSLIDDIWLERDPTLIFFYFLSYQSDMTKSRY
jgi:hypothetical protein